MPRRIENTIFISYRRTNLPWALAIYQNLSNRGYDVFFDFQSINSGDFEQIILGNIKARAHFIVLLTASALERCDDPKDWLRREIESAIDAKRNIVPMMLDGFDFGAPATSKYLTGKLALLKNYNGLRVHSDYFEESLNRLCARYLNTPLDMVLHPVSITIQESTREQQSIANTYDKVEVAELEVEKWLEKGNRQYGNKDYAGAITSYTEAIRLKSDYALTHQSRGKAFYRHGNIENAIADLRFALGLEPDLPEAYCYLGHAYDDMGNRDEAIKLYNEAIRLKPDYGEAFRNRGLVYFFMKNYDLTIKDATEAIRLQPDYVDAYDDRGLARKSKGDLDGAIKDFTEAIRLQPDHFRAHQHRSLARYAKGDLDGAIKDITEVILLKPDYPEAYNSRGRIRTDKGDFDEAIEDFTRSIELHHPELHLLYNNRSITYYRKGDYKHAIEDCEKAIQIKPDFEQARQNLMFLRSQKG